MEAVGAARNRAQARHRKARASWVSQPSVVSPLSVRTSVCIGVGVRVKLSAYPGRPVGLRGNTVAAENERTRRESPPGYQGGARHRARRGLLGSSGLSDGSLQVFGGDGLGFGEGGGQEGEVGEQVELPR
jgi:hypothetical protein